ncbi:MAG: 50S ribosomal protein L13 [Proteobacteria bacterium]|jgi:large subunit ribosomal protein L13|nr:50S ribosomal protein L13 [Pseudomonadota bacterium]
MAAKKSSTGKTKTSAAKKSSKDAVSQESSATNKREKIKPEGVAAKSSRITDQRGPIRSLASQTPFVPTVNHERQWLLIDAKGLTVGRLATECAMLLRGKHKASFTPNNDAGDFVVILNAGEIKFSSGKKEEDLRYYDYSGWVGGLKVRSARQIREKHPERLLEIAVAGMLPRGVLGRNQMKKLKVYASDKHPHAAQNPQVWNFRYSRQAKRK